MSFLLGIIYLSFISLGLPDALLGSAWPNMYPEFQVPVSYAGMISMIIAFGTILSSLQSDRLTKHFGTGKVTAASVAITALALWGFSVSHSFLQLCLWAIPYGLGAGSVDASLNNYVALHYASKHMSWLHCMWGVGTTLGPLHHGSGAYRRSRVEYGISGYVAATDGTYSSFDHQSPQVEGRESCRKGSKGWETAHLQGNYIDSGGKGNHTLFLLLLRCRADNDALG